MMRVRNIMFPILVLTFWLRGKHFSFHSLNNWPIDGWKLGKLSQKAWIVESQWVGKIVCYLGHRRTLDLVKWAENSGAEQSVTDWVCKWSLPVPVPVPVFSFQSKMSEHFLGHWVCYGHHPSVISATVRRKWNIEMNWTFLFHALQATGHGIV